MPTVAAFTWASASHAAPRYQLAWLPCEDRTAMLLPSLRASRSTTPRPVRAGRFTPFRFPKPPLYFTSAPLHHNILNTVTTLPYVSIASSCMLGIRYCCPVLTNVASSTMPPHPAADAQPPPPLEMASGNSIYAQRNVLFGMPAPPQGSRFRNRASYNVPLTSLHHAVFLIQEESAAPVSDLLRLNLTDDEIRELLDQVDAPSPQAPASDLQASRSKWNSRHASAVWESRAAGVARLRTKMDEQRAVYATVLRDYDHRDVEVIYSDTLYEHDRLRADFDAIRQKVSTTGLAGD